VIRIWLRTSSASRSKALLIAGSCSEAPSHPAVLRLTLILTDRRTSRRSHVPTSPPPRAPAPAAIPQRPRQRGAAIPRRDVATDTRRSHSAINADMTRVILGPQRDARAFHDVRHGARVRREPPVPISRATAQERRHGAFLAAASRAWRAAGRERAGPIPSFTQARVPSRAGRTGGLAVAHRTSRAAPRDGHNRAPKIFATCRRGGSGVYRWGTNLKLEIAISSFPWIKNPNLPWVKSRPGSIKVSITFHSSPTRTFCTRLSGVTST